MRTKRTESHQTHNKTKFLKKNIANIEAYKLYCIYTQSKFRFVVILVFEMGCSRFGMYGLFAIVSNAIRNVFAGMLHYTYPMPIQSYTIYSPYIRTYLYTTAEHYISESQSAKHSSALNNAQ